MADTMMMVDIAEQQRQGDAEEQAFFALQEKAAEVLAICNKFPLDHVVARVLKEQPTWTMERATVAAGEYRKWLVLCAITPEMRLGMCSTDVDEIWHAHILFTRDYMRCCNAMAGRYLHHQPTSDEEKATGGNTSSIVMTKKALKGVFGHVSPVWSRAGGGGVVKADCCSDCGKEAKAANCCSDCGKEAKAANCCSDCGKEAAPTAAANCCSDCGHGKDKTQAKANCCSDCGKDQAKAGADANCCSDCGKE